jgi:hypothetical protein
MIYEGFLNFPEDRQPSVFRASFHIGLHVLKKRAKQKSRQAADNQ